MADNKSLHLTAIPLSAIARAIKRGGVNVWLDEEQLVSSQSLSGEISRALGKMTHFVLFWSARCVGAPWVERELNSAIALLIEKAIPLVIVRLDPTPVPAVVADLFRIEALGEDCTAPGFLDTFRGYQDMALTPIVDPEPTARSRFHCQAASAAAELVNKNETAGS